jgi:hypothetical protein
MYIHGIDIKMLIQNGENREFEQFVYRHTQGRATPLWAMHERMRASNSGKIMNLE